MAIRIEFDTIEDVKNFAHMVSGSDENQLHNCGITEEEANSFQKEIAVIFENIPFKDKKLNTDQKVDKASKEIITDKLLDDIPDTSKQKIIHDSKSMRAISDTSKLVATNFFEFASKI